MTPDDENPDLVLAIDPGKSGGFVWGTTLDDAVSTPMPKDPKACRLMLSFIKDNSPSKTTVAYMEFISGFMGGIKRKNKETGEMEDGGVSPKAMFSFGKSVMMVEMGLECADIECRMMSPQFWMRKAKVSTARKALMSQTQWKNYLKKEAHKRFPAQAGKMTLKTADAFLIYYAVLTNDDL